MNNDDIITTDRQYYSPKNKQERQARTRIWDRYRAMRDDTLRKKAEEDWEMGDKMFMQWMPERNPDDWESKIVLPDAFAAIQTHMQETVERKSRPAVQLTEQADLAREMWANSIMTNSMDRTGYDYQQYLTKQCAAIRGTAFAVEYYRLDKRDVKDPTGVNDDGTLKYTDKEIIDFDDTYTEFKENEYIFTDPGAKHQDDMRDFVEREILDWKEFQRVYNKRGDFMNIKVVPKCGSISDQVKFFERPKDMTDDDVEILHYYNRATDSYDALANNVLIRNGPIPFKHKELPLLVYTHYNVPGRLFGIGIPKVIYSLTEERQTFRRMASNRTRMSIDKMFLVNDLVDLDDEDVRTRPNGFIPVNTNGLSLAQVIEPLEYGDLAPSYYQLENLILSDIKRATGITDTLEAVQSGGTATEAAMLQQTAQKRINMINVIAEMDTVIRNGKLKWSNIQFFYPAPRVETITQGDKSRTKKTYKSIKVEGMQFSIETDPSTNQKVLKVDEIDGASGFTLNKAYARFLDGDWETTITSTPDGGMPKALKQAKITEMFQMISLNPILMAQIEPKSALKRYLMINDEDPKLWLKGSGLSDSDWKRLAQHENLVMAAGQPISPTQGAPTIHTEEHLNFVNSADFQNASDAVKAIFQEHILGEHQNNPDTGNVAGIMPEQPGAPGGPPTPGGPPAPTPAPGPGGGQVTPASPADITPSSIGGTDQGDRARDKIAP